MTDHVHVMSAPVPASTPNQHEIPEHMVCVEPNCTYVRETDERFGYAWDSYADFVEFYERESAP